MWRAIPLALLALPRSAAGGCPFAGEGPPPAGHPVVALDRQRRFAAALEAIDFDAVRKDIQAAMTDSQDFWPADFGNYGPLFVRLAWHCSGSYRMSDGRGGCDGARIRFDPERSWEDNTNLDKARRLLAPIKAKHGAGLSWGDLIVLAGNTAIESMGGPILGFCAGRIDAEDGSESLPLGPTAEQQELFPCDAQGACEAPLGTTTVGLIYVNPEGPLGTPSPVDSAMEIREVFARMGMNDSETVALIGGGHAFGKAHGACPEGAGPSPRDDPANPWPGKCGSGKGADTFTSGFELQWTPTPTAWSNAFFRQLLRYNWTASKGPGGHYQWFPDDTGPELENVSMLTSDRALKEGPYLQWVQKYAEDLEALNHAFSHAWYKLTTHDMGPSTRCFGKDAPPAQPFQFPLPAAPARLANFAQVRRDILDLLGTSKDEVVKADVFEGEPYYGAFFVRLAWHCSSTFRASDWRGGCNGARIRHSPESEWGFNAGLSDALQLLVPIKEKHGDGLSWADLIVLAGTVAVEEAGGRSMRFCGGRVDVEDGSSSEGLKFKFPPNNIGAARLKDNIRLLGMTLREFTALTGGGHALGKMHVERSGFTGQWTTDPRHLDNEYFQVLLGEDWETFNVTSGAPTGAAGEKEQAPLQQFKAKGKGLFMLPADLLFRTDPELAAISEEYAADNDLFLDDFAAAWTRLMEADRFSGPAGSVCEKSEDLEKDVEPVPPTSLAERVVPAVVMTVLAMATSA